MGSDIIIERDGITVTLREVKLNRFDNRSRAKYWRGESQIYVNPRSETVIQNLENRRQRPYTIWKKELLPLVAKMIKEETGLTMGGKRSWSQYLGCSCPCSPGFRTTIGNGEKLIPFDVWVEI